MAGWFEKLLRRLVAAPTPAQSLQPPPPSAAPLNAATLLAQGNELLGRGRIDLAAQRYQEALAQDPGSVMAAVNLGFALLELGRAEQAVGALNQALAADAGNADALFMLGRLALDRGQAGAAIGHLSRLIEAQPSFALAYPLLGRAHIEAKDPHRAKAVVMAGLAVDPSSADLHHYLGNLERLENNTQAAASSYRAALERDPRRADSRASLGYMLVHLGQLEEARRELLQALVEKPASAEGCHLLGTALQAIGALEEATKAFEQALAHNPQHAASHQSLGIVHQAAGRFGPALASFLRVTTLEPNSAVAWSNLGTAHQDLKQYSQAEDCYRRAIAIDPRHVPDHAHLGVLAVERGATAEAMAHFETALALDPNHLEVLSHRLWTLSYGADPAMYVEAARDYGHRVAAIARPFTEWQVESAAQTPRPAPLRVGLVSGDLRAHPVGFFIESVLRSLSDHGVEVHAFPSSSYADEVTARLKQRCASWTPLVGMYDEVAAQRVREQRIHVLIDLAGHTAHHRLRVFAWRPAPVQVSWLGFFASTGVGAIDYLIADEPSVPDALLGQFTESVWRMPHTRLCFTAPATETEFPVAPAPALKNGFVTLGCYQNLSKLNDGVLQAWQRVMQALPTARLRLQNKQVGMNGGAEVLAALQRAGLPMERVALVPPAARNSYLASYAEVDMLLDSFPFPGGTTTCEALWMGVPTVALGGNSMLANQGKALLTCAGLPDWVARSQEEYVDIAVHRARDTTALAALRRQLRAQVLASPLFDGERFAADLAHALFDMWQRSAKADATSQPG